MFRSNTDTTCSVCGAPIKIGEPVSWSRKSTGVFHPACHPSRVRIVTVSAPMPQPTPIVPTPIAPTRAIQSACIEPYKLPEERKLTASSQWYEVLEQLTRVLDRILLVGPPSSGKSTTAIKTLGIKHRITMTPNTGREDLCGMFHLIDGQTVWIDGPITKAMRNGHPVLIDEIDRAGAEVESLMYSVIDDQPHLSLPNGELVQASSGYKVLMTSNQSPDVLEDAVRDRMEAILLAYNPHKDALSGMSEVESTLVQNYYRAIPKPTLRLNPTVRRMRAFNKICKAGIPVKIAAVSVFGPNASPEIQSVIANIEAAEVK